MSDESLEKIEPGKRAFIKKVAAATVFTIPVVQSFSMGGFTSSVAEAKATPPPVSPSF